MVNLGSETPDDESAGYRLLATLLCILSVALLAEFGMERLHEKYKKFPLIPSCYIFMFVGLIVGLIHEIKFLPHNFTETFDRLAEDFPSMMLTIFLPAIVLHSGVELGAGAASGGLTFAISRHHILPALLLAVVGTIFAILSGGAVLYGLGKANFSVEYCIVGALLVSTCIAPSDTVAVLNVFDSLDVKKSLYALFYFESMFNDAVALVSFSAFRSFLDSDVEGTNEVVKQSFATIGIFIVVFVGSGVIGVLIGLAIAVLFRFGNLTPRWSYFNLSDSNVEETEQHLDSSMSYRNAHELDSRADTPFLRDHHTEIDIGLNTPSSTATLASALATATTAAYSAQGSSHNPARRRSISFTVSQPAKSRRPSIDSAAMPATILEEVDDNETIISDVHYREEVLDPVKPRTSLTGPDSTRSSVCPDVTDAAAAAVAASTPSTYSTLTRLSDLDRNRFSFLANALSGARPIPSGARESIGMQIAGVAQQVPQAEPKEKKEHEHSLGHDLERCIVILAGFASYMITEAAHCSGVVAALFTGIAVGAWALPNVDPSSRTFNLSLLRVFSKMSDSTVFLLMGVMLPMIVQLRTHWKTAFALLIASVIGRFCAVYFSAFLINPFRDKRSKVTESHRRILFWGGLRGGLALALAFEAKHHLEKVGDHAGAEAISVSVLFVAMITLIIVPVTMGPLLSHLNQLRSPNGGVKHLALRGRAGGWMEISEYDEDGDDAMGTAKRPLLDSNKDDNYLIDIEEEEYFPPVPENAVDTRIFKRIRIFFTTPAEG